MMAKQRDHRGRQGRELAGQDAAARPRAQSSKARPTRSRAAAVLGAIRFG